MGMLYRGNMYDYHEGIVANQMSLLMEYSRSVAFFDEVKTFDYHSREDAEYWIHLSNMAINDSIIKWTKVFGTDDNELHWKKSSDSIGYQYQVRSLINGLFKGGRVEWVSYHKSMVTFRNTYSAHRDIQNYLDVPFINSGFKVAEVFFDFLVKEFSPWSGRQPYLKEIYNNHQTLVRDKLP